MLEEMFELLVGILVSSVDPLDFRDTTDGMLVESVRAPSFLRE